jgi:ParB family transcriptional regulator, chromosome partitioning protein
VPEPKRGLGRGLGALIAGAGHPQTEDIVELAISSIVPNPSQPRTLMNEESIGELADSVGKVGVLQPIIVRAHGDSYQIVAGERRWRAARAAGLEKVPVRVVSASEGESLELALIENLQRQDLNAMEEAHGYRRLLNEYQLTQAELADKVSKSRSAVTNTLRLLDLPDEVQDMLSGDKITAGHARAILSVTDEDRRVRLAEKIVSDGLSVREAEALARLYQAGQTERAARPVSPKSFKVVARKLRRLLGTNVRVRLTAKKGKIEIDFQGEDELERIFRALTEGEIAAAGEQS